MSNLQSLIDEYVARHGSSYRAICDRLGWSHGTISSWFKRARTNPPLEGELRSLAVQIQTPYKKVLEATLLDYGYLPEEGPGNGAPPAKKIAPRKVAAKRLKEARSTQEHDRKGTDDRPEKGPNEQ